MRDRLWQYDQSPARVQEREQSFYRALDREFARTVHEQTPSLVQERVPRERQIGRVRTWGHSGDDQVHGGAQVRLEREQDLGWGR